MLEGGGGRALLALEDDGTVPGRTELSALTPNPKGPKYLYGTKYGFCSSDFPYGLGKYTPYGYSRPFGQESTRYRDGVVFLLVPTVECGILRHSFLYVRGAAVVLGPCVVEAFLHA